MKEFNFNVNMMESYKTMNINTNVKIYGNTIKISSNKGDGMLRRRFSSFLEGESEFNISDIKSIKISTGFVLGFAHIFLIVMGFVLIWWGYTNFTFSILIWSLTLHAIGFKSLKIEDNSGRVIMFPVRGFYTSLSKVKNDSNISDFINNIVYSDSKIDLKVDRKFYILFFILILLTLLYIVGCFIYQMFIMSNVLL